MRMVSEVCGLSGSPLHCFPKKLFSLLWAAETFFSVVFRQTQQTPCLFCQLLKDIFETLALSSHLFRSKWIIGTTTIGIGPILRENAMINRCILYNRAFTESPLPVAVDSVKYNTHFLQCPHQGAKNSTNHTSSPSSTSLSKLLSVSSTMSSLLPLLPPLCWKPVECFLIVFTSRFYLPHMKASVTNKLHCMCTFRTCLL